MIFRLARGVAHDAFKNFRHAARMNLQPRLFQDLTADALFQGLADFEDAAGERPVALEWRLAALDHQDAVAVQDDGADPQDWARRIAPVVRHPALLTEPRP